VNEAFTGPWLALREPFDAAARCRALAERFASLLPARPRLLDLGAGTFGLLRFLAPIIGRAQVWTLAEIDPVLIELGFTLTERWARQHRWAVTFPGKSMLIHTPTGAWRLEGLRVDLVNSPDMVPIDRVDGLVCSALLDLVSANWLRDIAAHARGPVYATLSVDGRESWAPRHRLDPMVRRLFRRDQGRDKGFGPALGPFAPATFTQLFQSSGFAPRMATSDWLIARTDVAMAREIVHSRADASLRAAPFDHRRIEIWRSARLRQAGVERLAIRIGHRDSLAIPRRR
jgi:hypothetical protein